MSAPIAMANYNVSKFTRQLLKKNRHAPPSLVLHLYPTYFRFEQQHGHFGYDSPMKCFLEAIREQTLPTELLDVLDNANIKYYQGCLIVEVHDHRSAAALAPSAVRSNLALSFGQSIARDTPQQAKAEVYRIVLGPNPATLWTDLGILDAKREAERASQSAAVGGAGPSSRPWTEDDAVQLEAIILARTAAPLCLSPSLQTSRIANSMLHATTLRPPKRKRCAQPTDSDDGLEGDSGGEESQRREREEREKMMKIGDDGVGRGRNHAFARMTFITNFRERGQQSTTLAVQPGATATSIRIPASKPPAAGGQAGSPPPPSAVGRPKGGRPSLAGTDSEVSTPIPVGTPAGGGTPAAALPAVTKKQKKQAQLNAPPTAAELSDPTLPTDPVERDRVLLERRKAEQQKKKMESKKKKEAKRAKEAQEQAPDLQVGDGSSWGVATPRY